jgi:hypothetical protein
VDARRIDTRLEEAHDAIYGLQATQRELSERAALAKVRYEVEAAKAQLVARDNGLTQADAKAVATVETEDQLRDYLLADAELRSNRGAITTLQTQVDILRTLAVTHRSMF